jgi:3-hydroxybutyryl-CoA dehydratase
MEPIKGKCEIGVEVDPLIKAITQHGINLFEWSGGETGPSQFTDEVTAGKILGTTGTVASGRMSITFALEMLRRYFGANVFNTSGMVDLRFLRPVRPGNVLTLTGHIADIVGEANGRKVTVNIEVQNQDGNTTGVGTGSVIIPNAYLSM